LLLEQGDSLKAVKRLSCQFEGDKREFSFENREENKLTQAHFAQRFAKGRMRQRQASE
jgi:hypothetical protein